LDKGEFLALFEKRFEAPDQDHDGTLDKTNLKHPSGQIAVGLFAIQERSMM
jgi:hypothetical protein